MSKRRLNPLTQRAVAALVAETGHALTLDDFDHIAHLNRLADKITEPADKSEQEILALPVPCGNSVFSPPSLAKLYWYATYAVPWFQKDEDLLEMAFGFILASDNTRACLASLSTPEIAGDAVRTWWAAQECTMDEYVVARNRVWRERDDDEDDEGDSVFGPTCALLAREYGENPAWWFYEADINLIRSMLAEYVASVEAEIKAQRKATKGGGRMAKPVAPPMTPSMQAQRRFRLFLVKLKESWLTKQKSESALTPA